MRRVAFVLALVLPPCADALSAQTELRLPTVAERMHIASRLYAATQVYFAHWDGLPRGFDLDSVYREYLDSALAATDRLAFTRASMRFIASLRNGHSNFNDRVVQQAYAASMGFTVVPVGREFVVAWSRVDGLRPGDVIAAIDGEPMEQVFQRLHPYVSASHVAWARRSLFWYRNRVLFPERFTLSLADGRTLPIVRRDAPQAGTAAGAGQVVESRWLVPDQVAYVRVRSFDSEAFRDSAVAAVKRMLRAPALVVDVRENGGGTTPMALMELLQDREWRWYEEATPAGAALDREDRPHQMLRWPAEVLPGAKEPYRGRLVILADGGCFSACEDFLVPFKDNGRATIVGSPTGGSSGQPANFDLGDGMSFRIGMKREYMPDGSEFEGIGIRPDVVVEPTVEDIRAERDPVLERGLAIARAK